MNPVDAACENLMKEYGPLYHWIKSVGKKNTEGKDLLVVHVKPLYWRTANAVCPWKYEGYGVIVKVVN